MSHADTSPDGTIDTRNEGRKAARFAGCFLLGFAILWAIFYGLFRAFPYLSNGAEVIYRSKLDQELHGSIFPANPGARRVLIFGNSRVLAGFVPDIFDHLAAADGLNVTSYNSGYPARATFVPQLKIMVENKSNVPDILLLTNPWESTRASFNIFHPLPDDHDIVDRLFPFRYLLRDSLSFLITSREHGGVLNFYRESHLNNTRMLQDRGYYFISEQSHYPNNSLPDNFHLSSDRPDTVDLRIADVDSRQLLELNEIIRKHHIQCYFVPHYTREGSKAPAPAVDGPFEAILERYTSCKMLGPNYYLYPNHLFSDVEHLNPEGAKAYTEALYRLLAKPALER